MTPDTNDDPKPLTGDQDNNVWWCINGGADIMAEKMVTSLAQSPLYGHRVTAIELDKHPLDPMNPMMVKVQTPDLSTPETRYYSHVITTTTAACLQTMDLREAGLNYAQREAIRVLRYNHSIKVGIKFC